MFQSVGFADKDGIKKDCPRLSLTSQSCQSRIKTSEDTFRWLIWYRHFMRKAVAELMESQGFYLSDTGGGCHAYTRQEPDGSVTFITRADDAEAPEKLDERCTVVRVSEKSETVLGEGLKLLDALRAADI